MAKAIPITASRLHRAKWDELMAAVRAAEAIPEEDGLDRRLAVLQPQVDALAREIWSQPVRDTVGLKLLAETFHWQLWSEPRGVTDQSLARGPAHLMGKRGE